MTTIQVSLGARSYEVITGTDLLCRAGELIAPLAPSKRVFIVTDHNVAKAHLQSLITGLAPPIDDVKSLNLEPGEQMKSFAGLSRLTSQLLSAGINRNDLIIAFGGGVIGDLAGLAAGLVKRGVDFVQIPTTLLAQVDSSVGGKTAIDTPEGKNLVGLIHQPRLVIADQSVLTTLPARELRAGYAEIVKVGLIADAPFFAWCEANAGAILACNAETLACAVTHAIRFKARIVEADETEQGQRALLNLGHTFAHALEAHAGYDGALLHGEAVAAGIALAFAFSAELGVCAAIDASRVRAHLETAGFITDLRKLPGARYNPEKLLALMAADKKSEAGAITLILARGIGQAYIQKSADAEALRAFLTRETE
jgi:3-dehydroquinate synthase